MNRARQRARPGGASMGPRHDGRGKLMGREPRGFAPVSFNGATPRWAWKTSCMRAIGSRGTTLQWGHATMGVENRSRAATPAAPGQRFNGATPRWAWKTKPPAPSCSGRRGFNGATPRWAWKTPVIRRQLLDRLALQWGHATMGVENPSPRTRARRSGKRFNGATPRWAWKTAGPPPGPGQCTAASMGPRHDGRGKRHAASPSGAESVSLQWGHATMGVENVSAPSAQGGDRQCFNGATPRWAWKTKSMIPMVSQVNSFNGATPRWAWKTRAASPGCRDAPRLQWGHATMGVENESNVWRGELRLWASMGPRHDGRGKHRLLGEFKGGLRRFNGATPRWAWKTDDDEFSFEFEFKLQWGHATMGVENPKYSAMLTREVFGLQWGHATMGVENVPLWLFHLATGKLQWGHATMGVENRSSPEKMKELGITLQWGHATMGVENIRADAAKRAAQQSLQWGHATMGVENRSRHGGLMPRHKLQWGHATMGVENPENRQALWGSCDASMGPRHDGRGKRRSSSSTARLFSCFNGATPRW